MLPEIAENWGHQKGYQMHPMSFLSEAAYPRYDFTSGFENPLFDDFWTIFEQNSKTRFCGELSTF